LPQKSESASEPEAKHGSEASRLYVTHLNGGGVTAIDTATETIVTNVPLAGFDSWGLHAHPDGTRLYVTSVPTGTTSGGGVHVLDAGPLAVLTQIPVGGRPIG
jgi:YVTN family beta-propeller protein